MPASAVIEDILSLLPQSRARNLPAALFVVSGAAGPRWSFPAGRSMNPVLANWAPYRLSSRLFWHGLLAAQSVGMAHLLPHVQRVHLDNMMGIDWRALGWEGSTPPVPVIHIGTPGPQQKATIHLVDPLSGECPLVAKVPLKPAARSAVLREANVLSLLAEEGTIAAPEIVHVDESSAIATQRYVAGRPGARRFLSEYQNLLRSLVLVDERTTLAGQAEGWQFHPLWDYMEAADFKLLAVALTEQTDVQSLPSCWVHGDFAPWNIRHRPGLTPALIDWEMGERAGLPLQDAFHFLHIQDYLFEGRAKAHFPALESFANSLGISSQTCRKLEIAYLARTYFTCMEWDDRRRAAALLKALTLVLYQRNRSCGPAESKADNRLHLVTSRAINYAATRGELFSALVAQLNRTGIPYCVLSGYGSINEISASDVDVMFRPRDLHRIPALLARSAEAVGAHLVQSLQHETSACYFVLAKTEGKHITHLAIDGYGDYCRNGRSWFKAEEFIARRRHFGEFCLPSVADEFIYRLVKTVLKQSLNLSHLKQLQHLFARDALGCRRALLDFWPADAVPIEKAIVAQDFEWFCRQLPGLKKRLSDAPEAAGFLPRQIHMVKELGRIARRVLSPTGMHLQVTGDSGEKVHELADRLRCSLAPAFRRSSVLALPLPFKKVLLAGLQTSIDRIRSTVIITSIDYRSDSRERISRGCLGVISRPDLCIHIDSAISRDRSAHPKDVAGNPGEIVLNGDDCSETLAEQVNFAIVRWLEARTRKRLRLSQTTGLPLLESCASVAGRESAGLD